MAMTAQLSNGIKSQNSGMTIVKIMKKSIQTLRTSLLIILKKIVPGKVGVSVLHDNNRLFVMG
jgi:hypothetical protein